MSVPLSSSSSSLKKMKQTPQAQTPIKKKRTRDDSPAAVNIDDEVTVKVSTPVKIMREKKSSESKKRLRYTDPEPSAEKEEEPLEDIELAVENVQEEQKKQENKEPRSEVAKKAKDLKKERRAHKPNASDVESVKPVWEKLRRKDLAAAERTPLMAELHQQLLGKYREVATKHDGSRIIETAVKYASKEQRDEIVSELKGSFVELAKIKYSKHLVMQILKTGSRAAVISEFEGKMLSALRNTESAPVVDQLYADCCNLKQRNNLMLEFYGREFVLFRSTYDGLSLEDIMAKDSNKKASAASLLRKTLDDLLKKGNLHHSVVHRLIKDYLEVADVASEDFATWLNELMPHLKQIIHTMDGVLASIRCLTLGNAKARKAFIKSLVDKKSMVNDLKNVLTDEFAHIVLLGVFSLVDDTVLINESIVSEILKDFAKYAGHKNASQLVLFLFANGRNTRFLTQPVFKALEQAEQSTTTSKKPMDVRIQEIRAALLEPYAEYAAGKVAQLMQDKLGMNLLFEFLVNCPEAAEPLIKELIALLEATPGKGGEHLFLQERTRQFLKRLIRRASEPLIVQMYTAVQKHMAVWKQSDAVYVLVAMGQCSAHVKGALKGEKEIMHLIESTVSYKN